MTQVASHDEVVTKYFSGLARQHAENYNLSSRAGYLFTRRRDLVADALAQLEGGVLLDVGCGTGVMAPVATEHGFEYSGVDSSVEMIHEARRVSRDAGGSSYSIGRVEHLDFASDAFDVVLALGVLEYVAPEKLPESISELARVTKPGGTVILSLLNRRSPIWFLRRQRELAMRLRSRLLRRDHIDGAPELLMSRSQIQEMLSRAALVLHEIQAYAFVVVPARIYERAPGWWATQSLKLERPAARPMGFLGLAHLAVARKPQRARG